MRGGGCVFCVARFFWRARSHAKHAHVARVGHRFDVGVLDGAERVRRRIRVAIKDNVSAFVADLEEERRQVNEQQTKETSTDRNDDALDPCSWAPRRP